MKKTLANQVSKPVVAALSKPQRGRPRDPERLRRILEAAHSHFYEHGFERASVDAIAKDAGVSKMTLYSHFASKQQLFEALIGARTEGVVSELPGAQDLDPLHPAKALTKVGTQFLELMRDEATLGQFRALYSAAGKQPEACRGFYRQGADRLVSQLAAYLVTARDAGTIRVTRPRQAADLFLAMFLGDGHIRGMLKLERPDISEDKALLREAVRVFLAAYGV